MNIQALAEQCWEGESPKNFNISKFAELVAAHEREECAAVCEDVKQEYESSGHKRELKYTCADAIRARSKA